MRGLQNRQTVAEAMERTGTTTPSAALKKLKEKNPRFGYLAHVGEKQRRKARLRVLNQLTEIPTDGSTQRGFTGMQQMQKPEIAAFIKANPEMFIPALNMDAVFIVEAEQQEAA